MELCQLASFINEQEEWLDSLLEKLQWTREGLRSENESLEQCPYNPNHFVPSSSLEAHKVTCWYSKHGAKLDSASARDLMSTSDLYADISIPHVHIDGATERAVVQLAGQLEAEKTAPLASSSGGISKLDVMATTKYNASIEDIKVTPPKLLSQPVHQIISFIKSWQKIPRDFLTLSVSSSGLAQVKGWLFQHLPDKHLHSSSLGGEVVTVDTIMKWLSPDSAPQNALFPSPDALVTKLQPILGMKSKSFVLDLWKFIHISRLQSEHGLQDSFVQDIVPLSAAALLNLPEEDEEEVPSISERVKELLLTRGAEGEGGAVEEPPFPLPMDQVFYKFSTSERRMIYDYSLESTRSQLNSSSKPKELDSDLYRDDVAALKAKLKAQKNIPLPDDEEGGDRLEQLKRKRDYKRRRQAYRAKNVHITRRTPKEIFRDIISNRMEEITAAANEEAEIKEQIIHKHSRVSEEDSRLNDRDNGGKGESERRFRSPERERGGSFREEEGEPSEREIRRSQNYRSRSRSPSSLRSRSRERHHHRKRERKHRSRLRSRSKERSLSHKKKHKHRHRRSKSRSPTRETKH